MRWGALTRQCTPHPLVQAYNWGSIACNGGYSHEVLNYASQLFTTTEAAYPYTSGSTGVNGTCRVTPTSTPPAGSLKLSGSGYYTTAADATAIMQAVTTAPVVIYFYVDVSRGRAGPTARGHSAPHGGYKPHRPHPFSLLSGLPLRAPFG